MRYITDIDDIGDSHSKKKDSGLHGDQEIALLVFRYYYEDKKETVKIPGR